MVAKCCWRRSAPGEVLSRGQNHGDKERLIRDSNSKKRASHGSNCSSPMATAAIGNSSYEDDCDRKLEAGDRNSKRLSSNGTPLVTLADNNNGSDETTTTLIDLTSLSAVSKRNNNGKSSQGKEVARGGGGQLQHSPKVTFFDPSSAPIGSLRNEREREIAYLRTTHTFPVS